MSTGRGGGLLCCVVLLIAVGSWVSGDRVFATIALGAALGAAANDLDDPRNARLVRGLGIILAVVAVIAAALDGQWIVLSGATWAGVVVIGVLLAQRGARDGAFPSEELVGLTVAEAKKRIGFGEHREPHGLAEPTLVPIPEGDLAGDSASLIVTAVTYCDRDGTMTFGVTEPDRITLGGENAGLQQLLVDQVGGRAADILPLAKPDPLTKYRPRAM